jgi:hypothetical protein
MTRIDTNGTGNDMVRAGPPEPAVPGGNGPWSARSLPAIMSRRRLCEDGSQTTNGRGDGGSSRAPAAASRGSRESVRLVRQVRQVRPQALLRSHRVEGSNAIPTRGRRPPGRAERPAEKAGNKRHK